MAARQKSKDKDGKVSSNLSGESMKVIAESVGISGLQDEAAVHLAEDASYRLKQVIQVCYMDTYLLATPIYK